MARFPAIAATCETIVRLLRTNYRRQDFGDDLDFQVYVSEDFTNRMFQGVSLFLYRVYPNGVQRTLPGRLEGQKRKAGRLAVDLHFLLTAWGKKASMQHKVAGWMMRVMEDNPVLPSSLLRTFAADVFREDEAVEISLAELSTDDLLHIWELMINQKYELSVPYVARMVLIDSEQDMAVLPPVQERVADLRQAGATSASTP